MEGKKMNIETAKIYLIAKRQDKNIETTREKIRELRTEFESIGKTEAYKLCLDILDKISELSNETWREYDKKVNEDK
jgi:hypothetical protein